VTPPAPPIRTAIAVFVIAVVVYANTLLNGFVVDDVHQVVENDWITGVHNLPEILARGVWDFEGRASSYYRPLMYTFYMATWYVFGRTPWGYHLVNVLLHAVASMLVVVVAHRLLRADTQDPAPWLGAPFAAGLLFAVHPVHTEAVAWVAGITDVSMTVFCLLSLWLYIRAEAERRPRALALAAVSYFLAALSKETGVVFPLVLLAYEAILRWNRWNTIRVAWRLAPFAGAAILYLALRVHALGGLAPTAGGVQLGPGQQALTLLALFAGYVEKLVLPVNLNFWSVFVPPASLASAAALRALAVTAAALAAGWLAARGSRVAFFALALAVIPLLPAFHVWALNQGLENALAERYLYFPSVGFVLLGGLAAARLGAWTSPRRVVPALAVMLVAGTLAVGTVQRNTVWRNGLSLWSDAVRKSPGSAIAHKNHGAALLYAGRRAEGERELRAAVAMRPDLVDQELGKGAAYGAKGLTKKAVLAFHMALALDPRSAPAHFGLGVTYEAKGWIDAAIGEYEATLALRPDYAEAHNNVAVLYAQRGLLDRALPHFEAAVRLRPDDRDYRSNLDRARRLRQG
jgi:protein O-mannosyl-transferase